MPHDQDDTNQAGSTKLGEQLPGTNIMGDETLIRSTAGAAPGEYPLADPTPAATSSTTKEEILAAIERERESWEALLAEVGEDRMETPGVAGEWTFKDVVAHLSGWRQRTVDRLEAAARDDAEPPPPWPAGLTEDDEINTWMHARDRDRPLADVLAESRGSFDRLARAVSALPEADLNDRNRFAWTEGWALGPAFTDGVFFGHLHEEHEPGIRRWLAETTAAEGKR